MSWDPVWEKIFCNRPNWGKYPPEELIRFIAKHYYDVGERDSIKILEVGCGPGSGPSWFIAREGFSFFGIDGSPTAIEKAKKRFKDEDLKGEFICGNIESLPFESNYFDCVIDVACLQHNNEKSTSNIVVEINRVLKPGGRHFSLTAKNGCWGDGTGIKIDTTSFINVEEGPFVNMGIVRFASNESIKVLYSFFSNLEMEYSIRSMDNRTYEISNWIITCQQGV